MLINLNLSTRLSSLLLPLFAISLLVSASPSRGQNTISDSNLVRKFDANIQVVKAANISGKISQEKIDVLAEQTEELLDAYRESYEQLARYQKNIAHLEVMQSRQIEQKASLRKQMLTLSETETALVPLLLNMIDSLEASIEKDLPFLLVERRARIKALRKMISAPDLSLPNKYRQVLDAYEIERDFGYTLETYAQELSLDGRETLVQILRLGRIGLYYQTSDGLRQGLWDREKSKWQSLDGYSDSISDGISMANEQVSPTLLNLPVLPHKQVIEQQGHEVKAIEGSAK